MYYYDRKTKSHLKLRLNTLANQVHLEPAFLMEVLAESGGFAHEFEAAVIAAWDKKQEADPRTNQRRFVCLRFFRQPSLEEQFFHELRESGTAQLRKEMLVCYLNADLTEEDEDVL